MIFTRGPRRPSPASILRRLTFNADGFTLRAAMALPRKQAILCYPAAKKNATSEEIAASPAYI
jgi:hypothetical protein